MFLTHNKLLLITIASVFSIASCNFPVPHQPTVGTLINLYKKFAFHSSILASYSLSTNLKTENNEKIGKFSSFLSDRVLSTESFSYTPGIKSPDVFYPDWFEGTWHTDSVFSSINLPFGPEVIGGKSIYDRALKELNSTLSYSSIFERKNGLIVSARIQNTKNIAIASMGSNSILNEKSLAEQNPNPAQEIKLVVTPQLSNGTVYSIALTSTDRLQNSPTSNCFEVFERSKQEISIENQPNAKSLIKNIETVTVYHLVDSNHIVANQRTATFLSPEDPRYFLAFSREAGVEKNAIDIRNYILYMEKIS